MYDPANYPPTQYPLNYPPMQYPARPFPTQYTAQLYLLIVIFFILSDKSSKEPGDDIEQLPVDKIALILPGFVILAGKSVNLYQYTNYTNRGANPVSSLGGGIRSNLTKICNLTSLGEGFL